MQSGQDNRDHPNMIFNRIPEGIYRKATEYL